MPRLRLQRVRLMGTAMGIVQQGTLMEGPVEVRGHVDSSTCHR